MTHGMYSLPNAVLAMSDLLLGIFPTRFLSAQCLFLPLPPILRDAQFTTARKDC